MALAVLETAPEATMAPLMSKELKAAFQLLRIEENVCERVAKISLYMMLYLLMFCP